MPAIIGPGWIKVQKTCFGGNEDMTDEEEKKFEMARLIVAQAALHVDMENRLLSIVRNVNETLHSILAEGEDGMVKKFEYNMVKRIMMETECGADKPHGGCVPLLNGEGMAEGHPSPFLNGYRFTCRKCRRTSLIGAIELGVNDVAPARPTPVLNHSHNGYAQPDPNKYLYPFDDQGDGT